MITIMIMDYVHELMIIKKGIIKKTLSTLLITVMVLGLSGCSTSNNHSTPKESENVFADNYDNKSGNNKSDFSDINISEDIGESSDDSYADVSTENVTPTPTPIPKPLDYMYSKKQYENDKLTTFWIFDEKGNTRYLSEFDSLGKETIRLETEYVNGDCVTSRSYKGNSVTETKNEYDSNHNLIKQTTDDPTFTEPQIITYKYDSKNNVIEITTKSFGTTSKETFVYDDEGRELRYQAESPGGWGIVKETKYNADGQTTLVIESGKQPGFSYQNKQEYEYNSEGVLVHRIGYSDGVKTSEYIADKNGYKSYSDNFHGGVYLSKEKEIFKNEAGDNVEVTYEYNNEEQLVSKITNTFYTGGSFFYNGERCYSISRSDYYFGGESKELYSLENGKTISIDYYPSHFERSYREDYYDSQTRNKIRTLNREYYDYDGGLKETYEITYDEHGNVLESITTDGSGQTISTVRYEYVYKLIGSD